VSSTDMEELVLLPEEDKGRARQRRRGSKIAISRSV